MFYHHLSAHSLLALETESMRMVDDDEVGLKSKPDDIRYIKKITLK